MAYPLLRYDRSQTYDWNYQHAPQPAPVETPAVPGTWRFCSLPVPSPLGIAAGPLLNGAWCLYYAALGFDVVTYKTVRSRARACYELPNLQPVDCGPLRGGEDKLPASESMRGSWAVAFGMPSKPPEVWRPDVERTRRRLPKEKLLSVSVVGTIQDGWNLDDLADDYARCARWAVDAGADAVEANFSCPNVATCDGQLYQQPSDAALVAQRVRDAIGQTPLLIKIGHLRGQQEAAALVDALAPLADALAMTNSIAARVVGPDGALLFDGQPRGICGAAIRDASIAQVRMVREFIDQGRHNLEIVGVGGAATADDVRAYLAAGAQAIHMATAAMVDPLAAVTIRRDWSPLA